MNRKYCSVCVAAFCLPFIPVVSLQAQEASVTTWHNNNARTGLNSNETTLTPANVSTKTFGKVGFYATDGVVDAQPLHVRGVKIAGKPSDVVYTASEHGTVYAFNASTGAIIWKKSVLPAGQTPSADTSCRQIVPEIGVTATPVIDETKGPNGAIYIVNMSKDASGNNYHWLNALDLSTGAQLFNGPQEIAASYPGSGENSVKGSVIFNPSQYIERTGLLEWHGSIYTSWTSHCDKQPYTGWIISYDATTLHQTAVFNVTPNGSQGAIWMSGAGLAADPNRIYFIDGNGTFDTTLDENGYPYHGDFGNAMIALTPTATGLGVEDFYATDNTVSQSAADTDFGSGGVMVLPNMVDKSGMVHYLAVGAGKDSNIYVANRLDMGKYHPNGGYIYQVVPGVLPGGAFSSPAFFNNTVYYGGVDDYMKAFPMADAKLATTPSSKTASKFPYPGTTPSISSNGTTNGIVWTISHQTPATLFALDAANLEIELYGSDQTKSRDELGVATKFGTPTISNGRVYVGTSTGVAVYGLLGQ